MMRWPFGKDFSGMKSMGRPFLALFAEKDENNARNIVAGLQKCPGDVMAVQLPGEEHIIGAQGWNDIPTWELMFFDAWLKGDKHALELLRSDLHVRGGCADHKVFERHF